MARPKRARHRGRGEGSVYPLTRRWTTKAGQIRKKCFWIAATPGEDGKEFSAATAEEARQKRDDYLVANGKPVPRDKRLAPVTVREFAKEFLANRQLYRRAATHTGYEKDLRLHILPYIGDFVISELTDEHVRAMYLTLATKCSASRCNRIHRTISAMLNYALERKRIRHSPLATIKQDRPRYKRPPIQPLNETQVAAAIEASKGHRLGAIIPLAIDSGARQGELFALQWDDVDLERGVIVIRQQVREDGGHAQLANLKSDESHRNIDITRETVAALRRRKTVALKEGLGDCTLVFPGELGGLLYKSNFLRKVWDPIRLEAKIPTVKFHTLRHTCAILLLIANTNPKIVQQRLGHASIVITMDTYASWLPNLQASAAEAMSRVFGRALQKVRKGKAA